MVKPSLAVLCLGVIAHEVMGLVMVTSPGLHEQEPTGRIAGLDWSRYVEPIEMWKDRIW